VYGGRKMDIYANQKGRGKEAILSQPPRRTYNKKPRRLLDITIPHTEYIRATSDSSGIRPICQPSRLGSHLPICRSDGFSADSNHDQLLGSCNLAVNQPPNKFPIPSSSIPCPPPPGNFDSKRTSFRSIPGSCLPSKAKRLFPSSLN